MAFPQRPVLRFAILLIGIAILFAAIDWYRHRFVRTDQDLLKLLPGADTTVFFAQIDLLRKAGMLGLISDSRAGDTDYQRFVRETRFDYAKDIDAFAGAGGLQGTFIAVKGRFDWPRIASYVRERGGSCGTETCTLTGSKPQTWVGIRKIQPDVIGIGLGGTKDLVDSIHSDQKKSALVQPLPSEPVWVRLAHRLLKDPSSLPAALRIFLISLQSADSVVLSLGAPPLGSQDAFEIKLQGYCESAVAADTARKQLELQTKLLKLELARERQQPNPADLTGLLTSGRFDTSAKVVRGEWPINKEFLKALQ